MTTIADGPDTFGAPPARAAPRAGVDAQSDFEQLYAARFHGLTLQLYAYLGDLAEAQDVVQEAFCRAFARWSKISQYHDPVAWIRRVAWNLATSRFRRQRATLNFVRRQRPASVPGPSPDHVALVHALATVPPPHRRAVVLHYMAQLSVAEIAAQESVAEGTVKSWLSRGRTELAERLAERPNESKRTSGRGI